MELVVALDLPSKEENLKLVKELKGLPIWLKVGLRSYIRDGASFLKEIKESDPDFKIFLDLKLYDIPNTTTTAAVEIAKLGVEMFNLHISAGEKTLKTVVKRLKELPKKPLVLGVTALTSFSKEEFEKIYNAPLEKKVKEFAKLGYKAGLDGVVCSVYESLMIKKETSFKFLTLTPGIRPFGEEKGDQVRVATLEDAKKAKSDFIVVGRPIYNASNPKKVVERILEQSS
ncbi:MAG: orotidine-5'-phosphate decarboxylase [Epsilonproteobacteria bacterium]|nr:orotidine-5'-phosphate decarboxylase [Campylobacterota bacterium]